jgi:two-component system nitrate/nitrite sensor histidine kinase NarX
MRMQTWRMAQTLARADAQQIAGLAGAVRPKRERAAHGRPGASRCSFRTTPSQQAFAAVQRDWLDAQGKVDRLAWTGCRAVGAAGRCLCGRIDTFVSAIEHHLSRLTAILNAVQFVMVALTIGSAIALLYSAYLFIFNPLSRLQAGLARVEAGDLGARVDPAPTTNSARWRPASTAWPRPCRACTRTSSPRCRKRPSAWRPQRARLAALYESAAFVARADTLERWRRASPSRCARWPAPTPRPCAGRTRPTASTCCWRRTACRRRWSTKNCASPPATACAASPRAAP